MTRSSFPHAGLTDQVAQYVATLAFERLPAAAVDAAKRLLLDGIGCIIAGTRGSPGHIASRVPYKGSAPAYTDLVSGQVQLLSNNIISTMPLVYAGKLKVIAVMGSTRSVIAPNVPTVAESGLPGFDVSSWFGIVAPAKTPREIVRKLNGEVGLILKLPDVHERLLQQGAEPVGGTPEEFARLMQTEMKKWAEVIRSSGIRSEALAR
jgi:tripartite-type tricarboxylate transporter receptor subunit TctC